MIHIYDSLRKEKIPLNKAPGEPITMYVCGPTVYDLAHLGHGRSAVAFDIVRRFLEFSGHPVEFAFNITDIDDKMIKRAHEEGIQVAELAERIIPEYERDYGALKVKTPTHQPRATEFITQMIELVEALEKQGHTYQLDDGIYYDITTFKNYGCLSHQKMSELEAGARVDKRDDKRNHQDFVLWKFKKEGEPFWPSPWGEGRPGWHIECSAMSAQLLGESFDIHGGGLDLKFPHHECEIAQNEGATGKKHVEFWMHNGYITVNEEKMSKSLGNFFTLRDIFEHYHPRVIRFFLMSTHYRSPIEYSTELLEQARNTLKRLDEFYLKNKDKDGVDEAFINSFKERMSQDFDVAGALALLFEWTNGKPTQIKGTLGQVNEVFQIFPIDFAPNSTQLQKVEARQAARAQKDWEKSDALRDELLEEGIEVEDTPDGSFLKPKI